MAHADNLRRHFPAVRTVTYLNTGSYGPLPDVAVAAMQESLREQVEAGRTLGWSDRISEVRDDVRREIASLLQVGSDQVALTQSTTEAMNIVLWGLSLVPGDEIIVTSEEHPGALLPVYVQKQRRGVVIKVVDASLTGDALLSAARQLITPRTKLMVCSHVSYVTGHRMPLEALTRLAHEHHVLMAVDGAQGAGASPLSLAECEVDFYALPGHKWLCGPEGTGALYVRSGVTNVLDPTFVGGTSLRHSRAFDLSGFFLPHPDARRYEHSASSMHQWVGLEESLKFFRVQVGWDYAYTRIHGLSGQLLDQLLDLDSVRILTPRESRAGIISVHVPGVDVSALAVEADSRGISIRVLPEYGIVRLSTGLYNHEDDVTRAVSFLKSAIV